MHVAVGSKWCNSDERRGGMGRFCLLVSPPEVSGYPHVCNRTRGDGRGGFSDECVHSGENTRYRIRLCRRAQSLCSDGASKVGFEILKYRDRVMVELTCIVSFFKA